MNREQLERIALRLTAADVNRFRNSTLGEVLEFSEADRIKYRAWQHTNTYLREEQL